MKLQKTILYLMLCAALLTAACQPRDESPGTWLQGEAVSNRVVDWRFTDTIEEIYIETTPWYGVAHSTTIWCVQFQGELYVGSYGQDKKFWEKNIESNPEAKLRIGGKIYAVSISMLNDAELTRKIDKAYTQKYDMEEVFGEDIPEWWFYRVEQL